MLLLQQIEYYIIWKKETKLFHRLDSSTVFLEKVVNDMAEGEAKLINDNIFSKYWRNLENVILP